MILNQLLDVRGDFMLQTLQPLAITEWLICTMAVFVPAQSKPAFFDLWNQFILLQNNDDPVSPVDHFFVGYRKVVSYLL